MNMKKIILSLVVSFTSISALLAQSNDTSLKKQYLLIFRFKSDFTPPSQDAIQANIRHWQDYMNDLKKSGKLVSGVRPNTKGKTISGSEKVTNEGAYIANHELVSSFIIINASSMDEATGIAKNCPIFEFDGSVEIRPIMYAN